MKSVQEKLAILADAAKYDASCASSGSKGTRAGSKLGSTEGMGICHSYTSEGPCISLHKFLRTNDCVRDSKFGLDLFAAIGSGDGAENFLVYVFAQER